MAGDGETRVRLLESARQEFMEKGYMQASLRNICKNAGVTTGALYFFFQDKEDVFAALVEEPLQKLYEVMSRHYQAELELISRKADAGKGESLPEEVDPGMEDDSDDQKAAAGIVHYMYQYYDEFMLILTKSQGSRFEDSVDRFVEITERHYRVFVDQMTAGRELPPAEEYLIHWLSHMTIDMFVHLLTHESSEQAALQHVELMVQYMTEGWYGLFRNEHKNVRNN